MKRSRSLFSAWPVIVCGLVVACAKDTGDQTVNASCTPAFVETTESSLVSDMGLWKAYYSVALVGCRERLDLITTTQMEAINAKLAHPTSWSPIQLRGLSRDQSFRAGVAAELNALVGFSAIDEVLFHDIGFQDYWDTSDGNTPSRPDA